MGRNLIKLFNRTEELLNLLSSLFKGSMTKLSTNIALTFRVCLTLVMMFIVTSLSAQEVSVRGSVKDASGAPVIGATVKVAGAKTGVITIMDGEYLINCQGNTDLEFNYIGYKSH